jgi:hypothetical protein
MRREGISACLNSRPVDPVKVPNVRQDFPKPSDSMSFAAFEYARNGTPRTN